MTRVPDPGANANGAVPPANADAGPADPVVITGAGMVTCLGLDRHATWAAVRQGRSGMGSLSAMEQPLAAGKDGGQAPDLPPDESPGEPREVRYLRRAIVDALRDAGISRASLPVDPARAGLMLGTTLHGMRAGGAHLRTGDYEPLATFLAASTARAASRGLGLDGFAATTCSACSSALGAIALGVTLLREGQLDLVVAGGYDPISEYVYAGFNSLRLVSDGPLRPFARDRTGMKLAEGYAVVVLERSSDARRRGRAAMATVLGFGESADAHHLTQPHPKGDGAARAIRAALADATFGPAGVDLIVAHATGTPDNDAGEYQALSAVFGPDLPRVPVVGFKSHVGHTLGGAGAVELILAATAMAEGTIPPNANVTQADTDYAGLTLAAGGPVSRAVRATLSTSLGFGGANTAMVLGPAPRATQATASAIATLSTPSTDTEARVSRAFAERQSLAPVANRNARDVFITGVGVLLPGAIGNDAFVALLRDPSPPAPAFDVPPIEDDQIAHLISARRVRRLSQYVKYTLAAAALAFRNAGVEDVAAFGETCCAVLGTTHGSTTYSLDYYGQIVREGLSAANPLLFAEGVPNAAAAHLSLMMSVKGACQTIIGSRTAGLDALRLAAARIAGGGWDRALVGAGEEYNTTVNVVYRTCRSGDDAAAVGDEPASGVARGAASPRQFSVGSGAVMLLLESRASVEARGGRILGRVEAVASAAPGRPDPAAVTRVIRGLGPVDELVRSEGGLWVDRIEDRAVRRLDNETPPVVSSLYGRVAESFSAGPLAGVAAAVLNGGVVGPAAAVDDGGPARRPRSVGVIASDVTGVVSGVRLSVGPVPYAG
jgi:3-oxoacyl-[acyl-carrier-protein] synthase II